MLENFCCHFCSCWSVFVLAEIELSTKCVVEMEENQTILHPPPSNAKGENRYQKYLSWWFFLFTCNSDRFFLHNSVNSTNNTESDSLGFWFGSPCPGLHCQSKLLLLFFFACPIWIWSDRIRSVCPCVCPDSQSYSHRSCSNDLNTRFTSLH